MKIGNAQDVKLAISYVKKGGLVLDIDPFYNKSQDTFDTKLFNECLTLIFQKYQPSFLAIFSLQLNPNAVEDIMEEGGFTDEFIKTNVSLTNVFKVDIAQFLIFNFESLIEFLKFITQFVSITYQTCVTVVTNNPFIPVSIFHYFYQTETECLTVITTDSTMHYTIVENTFQLSRLGTTCPRRTPVCKPCGPSTPPCIPSPIPDPCEPSAPSAPLTIKCPSPTPCPSPSHPACPVAHEDFPSTPHPQGAKRFDFFNDLQERELSSQQPPAPKPKTRINFKANPGVVKRLFAQNTTRFPNNFESYEI